MGLLFGLISTIIFVILLIEFPKQTLSTIGLIILGLIILWYVSEQQNQQRENRSSKVIVSVVYDTTICSPEYPLHINISNNSDKTIRETEWYLAAYKPGYSSNLLRYGGGYSSDKIIKPGGVWSICYQIPSELKSCNYPLDKIEYKIENKYIQFED